MPPGSPHIAPCDSPREWKEVLRAIEKTSGLVLVLGLPDTGKSTWVAAAARWLGSRGLLPLAVINTDMGQASLGPPGSASLAILEDPLPPERPLVELSTEELVFVGSVSPGSHLLSLLVAAQRLVDAARHRGARVILVDTSGLAGPGLGFELKLRKVELLLPDHLVALQGDQELEPLLQVIQLQPRVKIHRLSRPTFVRRRSASQRAAYRAERFDAYFGNARLLDLCVR